MKENEMLIPEAFATVAGPGVERYMDLGEGKAVSGAGPLFSEARRFPLLKFQHKGIGLI